MDRTQKKCFVGVVVMHTLVLFIAIIGTAFFNKEEKVVEDRPQIIELINPNVTDGKTRPGAVAAISAEEVKPPEPAQSKPAPPEPIVQKPEPEPQRDPVVEQPKPEPVKPEKTVSELPTPIKKPVPKHTPVSKPVEKVAAKPSPPKRTFDFKPTVRNNTDKKAAAEAAEKTARDAADRARNRIAAQIRGTANRLGQNLSSSTTIDLQGATGDAGAVNYGDLVMKKYDERWDAPNEVDDNEAIVKAKIVIARSGNVISADIIKASGNAALDKSVRRALELRFIHPFPEGSKDSQRTYIINFNLKLKRGIG